MGSAQPDPGATPGSMVSEHGTLYLHELLEGSEVIHPKKEPPPKVCEFCASFDLEALLAVCNKNGLPERQDFQNVNVRQVPTNVPCAA